MDKDLFQTSSAFRNLQTALVHHHDCQAFTRRFTCYCACMQQLSFRLATHFWTGQELGGRA